jgi:hypothetical protein
MSKYSFKAIALIAASGLALSLASVSADAAKKKKRHYRQDSYSQSNYPNTVSGHNRCMQDQTRYPLLDIRC